MTKVAIRQAVAHTPWPRWHFVTFSGRGAGESRGVVPPVTYSPGTIPSHAENPRPFLKAAPLPIAAMMAVAVAGPMPGIVTSRRHFPGGTGLHFNGWPALASEIQGTAVLRVQSSASLRVPKGPAT